MKQCFEAGTIQAFLDGELAANAQESVARHVAECDSCALALVVAEEETAFALAALDAEFNALVPTNRLWTKINDSIESENKPIWRNAFAGFKNLFANASVAAFAGLIIVAGLFLFVKNSGTSEQKKYVSQKIESKPQTDSTEKAIESNVSFTAANPPEMKNTASKNPSSAKAANVYRTVKATFVNAENGRKSNRKRQRDFVETEKSVAPGFISGERIFISTIAALEKNVNGSKDEVLKPSARFYFEKDLAIADDAIARMKREVKQNPKNAAAKQILLASYQNKIDLLSSVADKTELMASLK